MTVRPLEPITIHRAACDKCSAILKDIDPDRLGREMADHEKECACR